MPFLLASGAYSILPEELLDEVLLYWGSIAAALCLAVILGVLRRHQLAKCEPINSKCTDRGGSASADPGAHASATVRRIWSKARYLLSYPLPPRQFWASVAGGAVSVLDVLVLGAWAYMAAITMYNKVSSKLTPEMPPEKRLKIYAKALGTATNPQLFLALLPVPRSSFLAWLLPEAEFSSLIKYHRWLSWGMLATSCLHGAAYMFVWLAGKGILAALASKTVNLFGLVALLAACAISITACSWMRRANYQLFYMIHAIGAPVFLVALFIHDRITAYYVVPAVLLLAVDRVFRTAMDLTNRTSISAAQGSLTLEGTSIITIKLPWEKGVALRGGETLYVTLPSLSLTPHPFSVADVIPALPPLQPGMQLGTLPSPQPGTLPGPQPGVQLSTACCSAPEAAGQVAMLHAKATGGEWTSGLRTHALLRPRDPLPVRVEGPYDSSLRGLPQAPVMVMVAGGIGITPLLSLLRRWARESAAAATASATAAGQAAQPPRHPCAPPQPPQLQAHQQCAAWLHTPRRSSGSGCASRQGRGGAMGADSGQCAGLRSSCDGRGAERCAGLRGSCDGDVQSLLGERALLQGPGLRQGHHIVQPGQQGLQWGQEEQRQWGRAWDVEGQCCGANVHCPAAGDSAATLGGPAAAEAARAAAAGPSHVYLVFSAKSLDELRLLGPELLDAAYGHGPRWLFLFISYTGFELEAAAELCAMCDGEGACMLRPSPSLPQLTALAPCKTGSAGGVVGEGKVGRSPGHTSTCSGAGGAGSWGAGAAGKGKGLQDRASGELPCASSQPDPEGAGLRHEGCQQDWEGAGVEHEGCPPESKGAGLGLEPGHGGCVQGTGEAGAGRGHKSGGCLQVQHPSALSHVRSLASHMPGHTGLGSCWGDAACGAELPEAASGATSTPPWLQCPPSRQPALYFACTCLGFVGAFLALMRLMPYVLQALATAGIGHGVVLSGALLYVFAVAGAALPPVLLLCAHALVGRLLKNLRGLLHKGQPEQQPLLLNCSVRSGDAMGGSQGAAPLGHEGSCSHSPPGRGLRVLPGYELDWDSKPAGKRVRVCRGRPQLTALLAAVQRLHGSTGPAATVDEPDLLPPKLSRRALEGMPDPGSVPPGAKCDLIPVLIGGPEPMWVSSQEACWQLNSSQSCAFLEPHRVAHLH